MNRPTRFLFTMSILLSAASFCHAAGSVDDFIGRYPGSELIATNESEYDDYIFPVSANSKEARSAFESMQLAGQRTVQIYEVPGETSSAKVFRSLLDGLRKEGVDIKFSCEHDACGRFFVREFIPKYAHEAYYKDHFKEFYNLNGRNLHILTGRYKQDGQWYFLNVVVAKSKYSRHVQYSIDLLKPAGLSTETLVLTADQMSGDLEKAGKVVLNGLFFEVASSELKETSSAALTVISDYLQANPDRRFLVVGHTDAQGSYSYNQELSAGRANAVVTSLTDTFGVSRSRLKAVGVAFASPAASNASEGGRSENRRVELVEVSQF